MSRAATPVGYEDERDRGSKRSDSVTPRRSRRGGRRRRSPKCTSTRRREDVTPRGRRRSKASPRPRQVKSKFRWEQITPKHKRTTPRQTRSWGSREQDVDKKDEEVWANDSVGRRERSKSYSCRVEKSRRVSPKDVPRRQLSRSKSDLWSKECKLSEIMPDCRLHNIEASGGSRDFGKWFVTLPPNCKVDKDVRTDRGVFKKDNFQSSSALNRYLGIRSSRSPKERRRR